MTEIEMLAERINEITDEMMENSARRDDTKIGTPENRALIERNMALSKEFIAVYGRWMLLTEPTTGAPN
jgi:hypothetical protein